MMNPLDFHKPSDSFSPVKELERATRDSAQMEQLTKKLEQSGVKPENATAVAEIVNRKAAGPIDHGDWMCMDASRFKPSTYVTLSDTGLTPKEVVNDPDKAEAFAGKVFKLEGIPSGNGDTETLQDVVPGHYDQAGHGIDLIGVERDGTPVPIEIKKYDQPSAAHLAEQNTVQLEDDVKRWQAQRESQVMMHREGRASDARADAGDTWKPEVSDWQKQIAQDSEQMNSGNLEVHQMDDLWTRDRWLKLIGNPQGQERLSNAGVAPQFLDYDRLKSSPELPEWQTILDRRTAVIVSDQQGDAGRKMFRQAIVEGRAKRVIKIQL